MTNPTIEGQQPALDEGALDEEGSLAEVIADLLRIRDEDVVLMGEASDAERLAEAQVYIELAYSDQTTEAELELVANREEWITRSNQMEDERNVLLERNKTLEEIKAGLITKIYELDQKCSATQAAPAPSLAPKADGAGLREAELAAALTEVMEWINNWDPNFIYDDEWPAAKTKAESALALISGAGGGEAWVLVPKEPTEAMLNGARDWSVAKYGQGVGNKDAIGCFQAMLAAAPLPSTAGGSAS